VILAVALTSLAPADKKKKEEETQILQLPKELPAAVAGETRRLAFFVTPLSAKGLLSQQVRDALKSLERQAAGSPVLQIRAFVAGTGDLRRVRDLVSETFTERRQPLPALSLIQGGALPLTGAQVVLEAVANGHRDLYPGGVAFFPGEAAVAEDPLAPVGPLLERTLSGLRTALQSAGFTPADVLRLACFVSSLEGYETARARMEAEYPHAARDYIQTERAPQRAMAACEATTGVREARDASAGEHRPFAIVGTPRVVFTGTQVSFGSEPQDIRLALNRLAKSLEPLGASLSDTAFVHVYPVSRRIEDQVRRQLPALFNPGHPSALSFLEFEGLSSADAGFAVDLVAAKE